MTEAQYGIYKAGFQQPISCAVGRYSGKAVSVLGGSAEDRTSEYVLPDLWFQGRGNPEEPDDNTECFLQEMQVYGAAFPSIFPENKRPAGASKIQNDKKVYQMKR